MPVRHRLCLQAGTTITPTLNGRDMPAENYLLKIRISVMYSVVFPMIYNRAALQGPASNNKALTE